MARLSDLIRERASDSQSGGALSSGERSLSLNSDRSWCALIRQELWKIREAVRSRKSPQLAGCIDLAGQLVQLLNQGDELVRWALDGRTEDYLMDNALHVAVLGAKVGVGLQYSQQDLERLVLVGLLHDVGMWTLPVSLVEKREALSEEERDILRTHPERGRRILAGQGSVFEWVSTISAQEHERSDGSGYPCRLMARQIAEPAQIIGMVDTLDAMVTMRPYRKRLTPHQGVRELLLHAKTTFSLRVLKALGDQITLYPIGTNVRLNTGEIGMVMRVNSRYPLRPLVAFSKLGEASELDLSQVTSAHIVEVVQTGIVL
ncbi:MAG TPA: HD domain-containing phosphohydrolase [Nitrospira sp.]|nr:HD domain-containing phosphohydrolase [Nitrospira sp.]